MYTENSTCCDLEKLISEFYNHLKKYLMGKIHNNELVEDIVQEVMLKVVASHQKNVQVKNIRAWVFQIARNTLIDYYRKEQSQEQLNRKYIDKVLNELQEKSFSPEEYLIPMINLLPPEYSHPLRLSDIENIPQAEIAAQLNLGVSATKMRIQRARKMLYNKFIECCDIEYTKSGAFIDCTVKESCYPLKNLFNWNENVSFDNHVSSSSINFNHLN